MRPVLIIEHQEPLVSVFNITTQYESKSETIRAKYFKINDWQLLPSVLMYRYLPAVEKQIQYRLQMCRLQPF